MATNNIDPSTGSKVRKFLEVPQLIALPSKGHFRIMSPVSKALELSAGDYIMFLNNRAAISLAIKEKGEKLRNFCDENNLDINSPDTADFIHDNFDMYAIAKGIIQYNKNGDMKVSIKHCPKSSEPKKKVKYYGSKLFNTLKLTEKGVPLIFSNTDMWSTLKLDMGENAFKQTRVFEVDIDHLQTINVYNGYNYRKIKAAILATYSDR